MRKGEGRKEGQKGRNVREEGIQEGGPRRKEVKEGMQEGEDSKARKEGTSGRKS
jgi:hypothetical protein